MYFKIIEMRLKASTVIEKMNSHSKLRKPFLFGLDFELKNGFFASPEKALKSGIHYNIQGNSNITVPLIATPRFTLNKQPIKLEQYSAAFENVQAHLKAGNSYLVNLTFPTRIETSLSLDQIYTHSKAKYKLKYINDFVVFSPETFIRIDGDIIKSFPMKGTIDAAIDDAENKVLSNSKEIAEHNTIVDLIRNDIGMVARDVVVKKFRYINRIQTHDKTLLQVSSEIQGKVLDEYRWALGDLIKKILPAGSISGAPKNKTLQIIKESEKDERGFYTGVFGYFDGENLDSAVMIRFIENFKNQMLFRSGGGITIKSNCKEEYQELIDKVYVPIV